MANVIDTRAPPRRRCAAVGRNQAAKRQAATGGDDEAQPIRKVRGLRDDKEGAGGTLPPPLRTMPSWFA